MHTLLLAQGEAPAGGAAIGQIVLATGLVTGIFGALALLVARHRAGADTALGRAAAASERASGLPGWVALPTGIAAVALITALFGMYWDISLHIDEGRDDGPLANPAHYPILLGLLGVLTAGWLALELPRGERPGPTPIRLAPGWQVPIGGILITACGAFGLLGFPLDDLWHRLFGQDVTLWGPTHLMMLGGAAMTLVGQAVLLREGLWQRDRRKRDSRSSLVMQARRVGLMGGLLIGISIFQAEFDFGVPQYRMVFQPMLIALGAGFALVGARVWIGRGGAVAAVAMFLVVRGTMSVLVGPVLGQTTPAFPLYVAEALCIELAGLALGRDRPLALGAAGGLLAGTVGFAVEWGWAGAVMPLPWTEGLIPEGLAFAVGGGISGGLLGGLLASGLRGRLPRRTAARAVFAASVASVCALTAVGLQTSVPGDAQAALTLTDTRPEPRREAVVEARLTPAGVADGAEWASITSWQGGGLVVSELRRVAPATWRSAEPVPVHGDWKTTLRINAGADLIAAPIYMPADEAIPAPEVPARLASTRGFVADHELLQREVRDDVPGWMWGAASGLVLALYLGFVCILAWGVARVARAGAPARSESPDERPPLRHHWRRVRGQRRREGVQ